MASASTRPLFERGWRYMLVGLVSAFANYVIMLAVDFAGRHYLIGTVISFSVVTPLAYALQSWFTFAEPFRIRSFVRFAGAVASTYPVAIAALAILCSGFGLSVAIAIPIATAALFAWNFVAAHWAISPRLSFTPANEGNQSPAGDSK